MDEDLYNFRRLNKDYTYTQDIIEMGDLLTLNIIPNAVRDLQMVAQSQMQEIPHCVRDDISKVRVDIKNSLIQIKRMHFNANFNNNRTLIYQQ